MSEKLSTIPRESSPTVDPETVAEIDSVEENLDEDTIRRLTEARERVARLMETVGPNPREATTEVIPTIDDASPTRELPAAETAVEDNEREQIEPRSRLRKIGDAALRKMEKFGSSKPAKLLESWGIIPVIGTRHKQRGLNFSAWIARKYVKAQSARRERDEREKKRVSAGFLSAEQQSQLNDIQDTLDEDQPAPSPEKIAQDIAYESYTENIDATNRRESQEAAYESYEDNLEATAERERSEAHERAEHATADKEERHERHPIRERAVNIKERLGKLRGHIGSSAMKLFRRTKSGLKSAANILRRRR